MEFSFFNITSKLSKLKIVFLSHTPRESIYKVGSYYLSKAFRKLGHKVLYISAPLTVAHYMADLLGTWNSDANQSRRKATYFIDEEDIINHVPFLLFPYTDKPILNSYNLYSKYNILLSDTAEMIKELGFDKVDLVLQDSLKLNFCSEYIDSKKWVYRVTDIYTQMPKAPKTIKEAERVAVDRAQQVITTSQPLRNYFLKNYNREAIVFKNGVDFEHFENETNKPQEYSNLREPILVYVGSMDERFNHGLIQYIATNSDYNIVLIGPIKDEKLYSSYNKVFCLGPVQHKDLPSFLRYADVGLLPFKKIPANENRSPMKIYEYGASGLPVVSIELEEIKRRNSKFVLLANDEEEFLNRVQMAISRKEELAGTAKEEALENSWFSISKQMLEVL